MNTSKTLNVLYLIILGFLLMGAECPDCSEDINDKVFCDVSLTPLISTMAIGDTVIISSSFSSDLELETNDFTVDNSNLPISFGVEVFEAVEDSLSTKKALDKFEYVDINGRTYPSSYRSEIMIENSCSDSLCVLEFGVVPKVSGYFGFLLEIGNTGFPQACGQIPLFPQFETRDNNNFELYEEIDITALRIGGSSFSNDWASSKYLYCFKVE